MILQNRLKIKEGTKRVAAPVTYKIIEGAAGTYTINAETATISRNGMSDIKYPHLQYRIQLMSHVQLVLWYRPLNVPGTAFRFLRESVRKVEASSSPL